MNGHMHTAQQRPAISRQPPKISEDKLDEIREAFSLFDTNKDGYVDYFELKVAMRALGFDQKKDEVLRVLQQYGSIDGSKISLDGFTKIMSEMIAARDPVEEYKKAFKLIDENNTGLITVSSLRRIARELGENIAEDEIQAMIDEFDLDNDGGINEAEFIKIMMNGH
ncbi:Calcium-binding component of the spindle pole body (SPB) half-bridge [Coemansia sp. RSA 2711]|nr:Calcium-binding component of the spindle pole body (SPB) half-bridge [Coemansia sp. RSA 2711]KAJ1842875.1 Calcium-binding component of the spindle pole body (SPB) half-bridge [Coemansia sp. RSA 2708]KAJ2314849.1 Calcium-binding component of the spindle pole body (SPB) half-bridge [Coemansia sp. RSA 2705]KAJ2366402.1 Calcium-binding component of the spindle pole body (SPB) half-bridge [Coemansia sp. RSA 2610]KAJ2390764.1 Calcium-binding component of the spindle pole body (SPB) half-bridge [Co